MGVPWSGNRLVDFRSHRLNWKKRSKAEKCRRDSLPGRQGRAEAGEAGRLGDWGKHETGSLEIGVKWRPQSK